MVTMVTMDNNNNNNISISNIRRILWFLLSIGVCVFCKNNAARRGHMDRNGLTFCNPCNNMMHLARIASAKRLFLVFIPLKTDNYKQAYKAKMSLQYVQIAFHHDINA